MWDLLSTLAALAAVVVALGLCRMLAPSDVPPEVSGASHRFPAIDGLRGLLALFVFLCHAMAWRGIVRHEGWHASKQPLFQHFGDTSVAIFFMVTAFLFVGRLLDARNGVIDWWRLYVSRVLRLTPAYWVAITLMLMLLAVATARQVDGAGSSIVLRGWGDIASAAGAWYAFCLPGMPAIDGYMNTPMIIAGVTWSLPFEWAFYLLLPLLGLPLLDLRRLPAAALAVGLAGAVWTWMWLPSAWIAAPFLGGIVAAWTARRPAFVRVALTPASSVLAIAALAFVVATTPSVFAPLPLVLVSLVFTIIAAGNTLFGLLTGRAARWLGQVGYSVYLLHGLVLYGTFMLLLGAPAVAGWSELAYWSFVVGVMTPVVVGLAHLNYRAIEAPCLRATPRVADALRRLMPASVARRAEAASAPPDS
jgi:peptidoglycan/LPS O-acetylase OafA/YrhL